MPNKIFTPLSIQVGTSVAPLLVSSPIVVTNLNADKIDGLDIPSITANNYKVLTVNPTASALEWTTPDTGVSEAFVIAMAIALG